MVNQTSALLLLNEQKRFILQHRTDDAPTLPGYWALFGGSLEENETPLEGIYRESGEELEGIILEELKFVKNYYVRCKECTREVYVYTAKLNYNLDTLKIMQKEGQGLGLFQFDQLQTLKIPRSQYALLKDLYEDKIIG